MESHLFSDIYFAYYLYIHFSHSWNSLFKKENIRETRENRNEKTKDLKLKQYPMFFTEYNMRAESSNFKGSQNSYHKTSSKIKFSPFFCCFFSSVFFLHKNLIKSTATRMVILYASQAESAAKD